MIYFEVFEKTVPASTLDYELGHLVCPEGYKITILEIGMTLPADSLVYAYLQEVQFGKVHGAYETTLSERIIIDAEVVVGQKFKITSSSTTGGATAVLVIYDKSRV